ncbi:MAG: hypothetical protein ACREMX_02620 [Gemmatimonadales bacterium]
MVLEDAADAIDWPSFQADQGATPRHQADHPMDGGAEEEFLESLGLSGEQDEAVEHLLDEREHRLEAYWAGKLPEIEALIDSNRMAIRSLLTPDHRAAYDRWVVQQRAQTPRP